MPLNVNYSRFNTTVLQKTAVKDKQEQKAEEKSSAETKELPRVDSNLALATLGVVKKTETTETQPKELSEMISSELLSGQKGNVTSFFYVNDIHGRLSNMEKISTASEKFDEIMPSYVDTLKFSAGDIMIGENLQVNQAANAFLNANNFMATVVGNHEVDQSISGFLESTQSAVYKILGSNAKMEKSHRLYNRIISSYVQEDKDKNKYGIIALMPFDLSLRSPNKELFNGLELAQMEETKKYLQSEVEKFEEKGINRIVMLSHIGYNNDLEIAKSVRGIDVILGGHSHDLITGLKQDENLIISKEDGSRTVITQAGRDGNYYGILNVEFDNNGKIIKAENLVKSTAELEKSPKMQAVFNKILGEPEIIANVTSACPPPKNNLTEENPNTEVLADVMKNKYKTDIGLVQAGNIRGAFSKGKLSVRDVQEIFPFRDNPTVITVSEAELVDAFKFSATAMTSKDGKPGLLQVSGVKYKVSSSGELVSLFVTDKDGKDRLININDPDKNKKYTAVMPSFLAKGLDGYTMLNKINEPDTKVQKDFLADIVIDDIKSKKGDISIKDNKRIEIIKDTEQNQE